MKILLFAFILTIAHNMSAHATVTTYTDKSAWQAGVGDWTSIDFTGWPPFTPITNQYAAQGVTFTDGNDYTHQTGSYQNDGAGIASGEGFGNGYIRMSFSTPQYWIGIDHPGLVAFELYFENQLIHTSDAYYGDVWYFLGFKSTEPFDRVVVLDPSDPNANIDDLFFGPPVPAPGALALAGVATLLHTARRRRT